MATAMYLEHYLDSLETLPAELQRNFNLLRDLDSRVYDLLKNIDKISAEYIKEASNKNAAERAKILAQIDRLFEKAHEYGDDKVQLANQTYEMVDKHIRRLDTDLARFEGELKDKILNPDSGTDTIVRKKGRKSMAEKAELKKAGRPSKAGASDDGGATRGKKRKLVVPPPIEMEVPPHIALSSISNSTDVLDMPVDPNEPTYCLCHQVSYGEMIGCDNNDCPIEWFHFACVGLTCKPKGKWYCPKCSVDRKKK